MEVTNSHHKMLLEVDQNSLIQIQVLENGGNAHSQVVNNGYGKLEFLLEETAVDQDLREQRSASVAKNVEQLLRILKTVDGMKSNVESQSKVTKLFSKLPEKIISQSLELKSTQLNVKAMAVVEFHK
jgi:hypothetical protein